MMADTHNSKMLIMSEITAAQVSGYTVMPENTEIKRLGSNVQIIKWIIPDSFSMVRCNCVVQN